MFAPRLSRIFASRWMALWWAASVLLLAWQIVPDPDDDAGSAPAPAAASAQANPWAIDPPGDAATGKARP